MKDKDLIFSLKDIETAYARFVHAKELVESGEISKSEYIYKELISQYPKYYAAHRELAKIYIERKEYYLAFQELALALAGDQSDYFSLLNLEALSFELEMFETGRNLSELIEIVGEKNNIKQHSYVHFFNKGKILLENKDYSRATVEFERCLHENSKNEDAALKLVECYNSIGKNEEALHLIEKFISNKCKKMNNFIYLLSSFPRPLIQENIKRYISITEKLKFSKEDETNRFFSLARFYHVDKCHDKAWEQITQANNNVKKTINKKYHDDRRWEEELLIWARDTQFDVSVAENDEPETLPLFMLGLSRSGKSSLEKALDWLPGARLGYENKLLSNATSQALNAGDRLPSGFLPFLPDTLLPKFVSFYRASFRENAKGASIYTTTTPGLITGVPAIIYALPKAKFIFMSRNPLDTAFRMYFTYYRNSHYHSYDIDWCLAYINWYDELVKTWEKKFPQAVMTVKYENLVTSPSENLKRILDFLEIKAKIPSDLMIPNDCSFSDPYHHIYK